MEDLKKQMKIPKIKIDDLEKQTSINNNEREVIKDALNSDIETAKEGKNEIVPNTEANQKKYPRPYKSLARNRKQATSLPNTTTTTSQPISSNARSKSLSWYRTGYSQSPFNSLFSRKSRQNRKFSAPITLHSNDRRNKR